MARPELPTDLAEDILLQLQVKDLVRCVSVSKAWFGLIKSPRFIKKYNLLHKSDNSAIIPMQYDHHRIGYHEFVPLSPPCGGRMGLAGSCNGFLCLLSQPENKSLHVWNPSDRNWRSCQIVDNVYALGFGYDETTGDYKAVRISTRLIVKAWNLRTHWQGWREISSVLPEIMIKYRISYHSSLFVGRNLYWLADSRYHYHDMAVISFDLGKETFGLITNPDDMVKQLRDDLTEVDFIWLYCLCKEVRWRQYFGVKDLSSDLWDRMGFFKV